MRQLPAGFDAYDGGTAGFRLGLAPGWKPAEASKQGISFTDPSGRGLLLVHYESAFTQDLNTALGPLMFELTGGTAGARLSTDDVVVAQLKGKRVIASFSAGSAIQRIEAYAMIESERLWAVVLAAPPELFDQDRTDFERIVLTFELKDVRPVPAERAAVGKGAPGFDLPGPAGSRLVLSKVKGAIVLNFFASWCPSCREEMPLLQSRADRAPGRFTLAGIAVHDEPGATQSFMRELKVHFPAGFDTEGQVADKYQVGGLPTTFFIDSSHLLRAAVVGPLTPQSLEAGLKSIRAD